jgi:hypothetical protein
MTDAELVHVFRRVLAAEDKPREITPLDLLQIIRFLVQQADEKHVGPSQDTLAEELCSSPDAIAKSQRRLHSLGWIVVRKGGYRGRTNLYTVQLEKLPLGDLIRTVVSAEAKQIAYSYGQAVRIPNKKKFMRNWLQQWAFQVQKLLRRTNNDKTKLLALINFALSSQKYCSRASQGPSGLRKCWRDLVADHENDSRSKAAQLTCNQSTNDRPTADSRSVCSDEAIEAAIQEAN